jgi:mono/diheme cytochrome c family protein
MAQPGRVQRGQTFAQTNCSQCHAIGRVGESPIPETSPFQTLLNRHPVEDLGAAFAEGEMMDHLSVLRFQIDPAQLSDLLAYWSPSRARA